VSEDAAARDLVTNVLIESQDPLHPTPARIELWIEVAVVLSVAWLPYMASILTRSIFSLEPNQTPFVAEATSRILRNITVDLVVLYVIYRSELSWADFGIKKPRLNDIWIGILTLIMAMAVHLITYQFAASMFDTRMVHSFVRSSYKFHGPQNGTDYIWLVATCLSNGFCEELPMRSYLITRLEMLLGSS